jgi:hypothetical protein
MANWGPVEDARSLQQQIVEHMRKKNPKLFDKTTLEPKALNYICRQNDRGVDILIKVMVNQKGHQNCIHLKIRGTFEGDGEPKPAQVNDPLDMP